MVLTLLASRALLQKNIYNIGFFCVSDKTFLPGGFFCVPGLPFSYVVALVSRIDKIIGLFCKRALKKRQYSAKETCNFIDPTNLSHPILDMPFVPGIVRMVLSFRVLASRALLWIRVLCASVDKGFVRI